MTTGGPTLADERITNLDAVRGLATLGILVMNAVSFGLPEAAYFNLSVAGVASPLDWIVAGAGEVLIDQKMMALFSLLFGAGVVLFADRAQAKGRRPLGLSLWRYALLLGIGFVHGIVWEGDILLVYALCAPVVLALRSRSPRTVIALGVELVVASAMIAVGVHHYVPTDSQALGTYWFLGQGPIGDVTGLFLIADFFLRSLGMMLIGVGLFRLGIVQGTRPKRFYRRMALIGIGVGLPLAASGLIWQVAQDFSPRIAIVSSAPNTLATIPLSLGYLALVTLWNQRADTISHERIRAVGRMALTNYVTQTIIGITVLRILLERGDLNRSGIAMFVISVWAIQLVWSKAWLERFRFGPFEWLWRTATYRGR